MHIRWVGHFGQKTGFGRAAEEFFRALKTQGTCNGFLRKTDDAQNTEQLVLELVPMSNLELAEEFEGYRALASSERGEVGGTDPRADTIVDLTVIHTLPADCVRALEMVDELYGPSRKNVAYTTWETLTAPAAIATALGRNFDEIWTPSRASANAFSHHSESDEGGVLGNVHVIPHCFNPRHPAIAAAPSRSTGPERPRVRFYWIGAWSSRKNPQGAIRAFAHAFTNSDDVELLVHSPGADRVAMYAAVAQTGLSQTELPLIMMGNDTLSDDDLWKLHLQGDVFVSSSRGEAWNLPAFEAMLIDNHVIAPMGLGSDDFLFDDRQHDSTNALAIPTRPDIAHVTVQSSEASGGRVGFQIVGAQGLSARTLWCEPDLVAMSLEMRHAYQCVRRGDRGRVFYDPATEFGYEVVARRIIERIRIRA